jgi:DNA-binding NarL/FixJ family response regulator
MSRKSAVRKINDRSPLDQGREALRLQSWGAAFSQLKAADREAPLDPVDLEGLAQAAHLIGRESESADFLARAHQGFLIRGEIQPAVRCGYRLGFTLLINGDVAQAGGWFSRAERLLDGQPDCVERGYLLLPVGYRAVHGGDAAIAFEAFSQAITIGERFGDIDLVTLARQGQGRALIRQGEITRGVSLLDEAMVAVRAGEVSPIIAGSVYCSVIEACSEIFDLRRAQEWTAALEQWCSSQPDVVPYRGHCLVRRAEILQLHGAWRDALDEAKRAYACLSEPAPKPPVGAALYRLAELHRLRGEFAEAEEGYRQASQWDRAARPGLAQLRLAQGQVGLANAAIRRIADEVQDHASRSRVLDAYVEIALAAKDVAAARAAADELSEIADRHGAPFLQAVSACAQGSVLLAEGNARSALAALRQSWTAWSELKAPYEAARVRVLLAHACRELGDYDAADLELAAAREVFQRLGAAPDLARVEALSQKRSPQPAGPLTAREVQVLKLVASGRTNRAIAGKLGISEKTVARHLSNIFNKLNLSSRAAATAYAYRNELV